MITPYADYFQNMGGDTEEMSLTQSAIRLYKMNELRKKIDEWLLLALKVEKDVVKKAIKEAKIFGGDYDYKDFCDFIKIIGENTKKGDIKKASFDLISLFKKEIVIENWSQDSKSHGLSIYIPIKYNSLYDLLLFSKESQWDEFIKSISNLYY